MTGRGNRSLMIGHRGTPVKARVFSPARFTTALTTHSCRGMGSDRETGSVFPVPTVPTVTTVYVSIESQKTSVRGNPNSDLNHEVEE